MGYVPSHVHDIFVSYAQVDDLADQEGVDGWVTTLIKRLRNRLAQLLGRQDNFSLWCDHHLAHHVNITPEIMGKLENTATLVVVISPGYLASEWCNRERETFLRMVRRRMGGEARVFLVERDKVDLESRPAEFGDLLGYRFWVQDREGRPPRILGTPRSQGDGTYFDVLNDLAWELSNRLKQLKGSGPPAPVLAAPLTATTTTAAISKPDGATTIYLAEVTDELDTLRTKLTRNLQQRNFRVVPDTWYPRDPEAFRNAVEDGLNQADLFV